MILFFLFSSLPPLKMPFIALPLSFHPGWEIKECSAFVPHLPIPALPPAHRTTVEALPKVPFRGRETLRLGLYCCIFATSF